MVLVARFLIAKTMNLLTLNILCIVFALVSK